jgi:hypothetical protein
MTLPDRRTSTPSGTKIVTDPSVVRASIVVTGELSTASWSSR